MGTGAMQSFSVQEQARFVVEVVAQEEGPAVAGRALGRSTKDCVPLLRALQAGPQVRVSPPKNAMPEVQQKQGSTTTTTATTTTGRTKAETRTAMIRTTTSSTSTESGSAVGGWRGGAQSGGRGRRACRRSPSWRSAYRRSGAVVLVRFDDGKWYGGRVGGFFRETTTPTPTPEQPERRRDHATMTGRPRWRFCRTPPSSPWSAALPDPPSPATTRRRGCGA